MPSGSTPSATRPYRAFGNLGLSNFLVFCFCLLETRFYSEYFFIPHNSSSSGVATSTGTAAPAAGTTAVTVAPGLAVGGLPQTPKGSLKTCWRRRRRSQRWRWSWRQRWCQWRGQ
jgi:hypothetical protein